MRNGRDILLKAMLFSTLLLCGATPAPRTFYLGSRISIVLTPRVEENSVFLKKLLRRTEELFPKPSHTHVQRNYLTIYPDSAAFRFSVTRNKWHLFLPGNAGFWKRSYQLRKKLYLVLWSAYCGFSVPQNGTQLPDWFASGCDEMLFQGEGAEQLLRNNRHFPAASALLDARLPLPDFRQLTELSIQGLSPAEQLWFREFSRLLLLILKEDKLTFSVLQKIVENNAPPPWYRIYEQRTSKEDLPDFLREKAMRIVRNEQSPASAEWLLKQTSVWKTIDYPELDERGRPTGKILTGSLDELPELCRTRPDAQKLRQTLASKVNTFARNGSLEIKEKCGKMAQTTQRFGLDEQALPDFLAQQKELIQFLTRKKQEEDTLANLAAQTLPPPRGARFRLQELKGGQNALSPAEQLLLRERERAYRAE